MDQMMRISRMHRIIISFITIIGVSVIAWEKVLSFWFFKGYEAGWLMSVPHTFAGLFRAHAYLYYLDYLLFKWNPTGWYATGIITHTVASLLVFIFILLISKRFIIALPASLFFVASITYHDVVTWGSFNSYYGVLVIFLMGSLISLHMFLKTKKRRYYFLSLVLAFFTFFVRESGLVLLSIIPLYLLMLVNNRKRSFRSAILTTAPFIAIGFLYFFVRSSFGDVGGDYADDSVQLRIRLLADQQYLVLVWRVLLAFGRHFASLWFPYPWLNVFRDFLMAHLPEMVMMKQFVFSFIGFFALFLVTGITYLLKNTRIGKYLIFSLLWTIAWNGVIALAIPSSDTVLLQDYFWNTRRYAYYAYIGVAFFWSSVLYEAFLLLSKRVPRKKQHIFMLYIITVFVVVALQVVWLRTIQNELLVSIHRSSRTFYQDFKKFFPSLPSDYVVYQYPHTDGLNDYLYEWSFVRESLYPTLLRTPFRTENQFGKVLQKVASGEYRLDGVIFLDYDAQEGLKDRTTDAKAALAVSKSVETKGSSVIDVPGHGMPIEIPYELELSLTAESGTPEQKMLPYILDRYDYLSRVHVTVSATMSQRPGEPFLHLIPEHLVDGNFGRRSGWIADSVPAVVVLDLGLEKSIGAVFWSSEEGPRVPSSYTVDISHDGSSWEKVIDVRLNTSLSRIDYLKESKTARYVRMTIPTTTTGQFVYLDEIEVVGSGAIPVISQFTDPKKLVLDSMKTSGQQVGWVRVSWDTTKTHKETAPQEAYIPIAIDGKANTYTLRIPEMEMFSRKGEFLNKFITKVSVEPFGPFHLWVNHAILRSIYEVGNSK